MKILVSTCLLGVPCRYDGKETLHQGVCSLAENHFLVPICPEQLGGLPTPRQPAEILHDRVATKDGVDVTHAFVKGAALAVFLAHRLGCTHAILKQNSPSCGSGQIYDGTFSGRRIDGEGITAKALKTAGVAVFDENSVEELLLDESR